MMIVDHETHKVSINGDDSYHISQVRVVQFQPGTGEGTVILIHPIGGTALSYRILSRHIPSRYRLLAITPPRNSDTISAFSGVGRLAQLYAAKIRTLNPQQPFGLGGWCVGGDIALSIAEMLRGTTIFPEVIFGIDSRVNSDQRDGFASYRQEGSSQLWKFYASILTNETEAEKLVSTSSFRSSSAVERVRAIYQVRARFSHLPSISLYMANPTWQIEFIESLFKGTEPFRCESILPTILWSVQKNLKHLALEEIKGLSFEQFSLNCYEADHFGLMEEPAIGHFAQKIVHELSQGPRSVRRRERTGVR